MKQVIIAALTLMVMVAMGALSVVRAQTVLDATPTPTASPSPSPTPSMMPTGAPQTGGGGMAHQEAPRF